MPSQPTPPQQPPRSRPHVAINSHRSREARPTMLAAEGMACGGAPLAWVVCGLVGERRLAAAAPAPGGSHLLSDGCCSGFWMGALDWIGSLASTA